MIVRADSVIVPAHLAGALLELTSRATSERLTRGQPIPDDVRRLLAELATLATAAGSARSDSIVGSGQVSGFRSSDAGVSSFRSRTLNTMTPSQYAERHGIGVRAVTKRLNKGKLRGELQANGRWLVQLDEEAS